MTYSIWTDLSFYLYLILMITSAVVIVSSIRRLINDEKLAQDEISEIDISSSEDDKVSQQDIVSQQSLQSDLGISGNSSLSESNFDDNRDDEEKIVFKKEDTIFDTSTDTKEDERSEKDRKTDEKAVMFLQNLNENLSEIRNSISEIKNLNERIDRMEKNFADFENAVKELIKEEISLTLGRFDSLLSEKDKIQQINPPTPKYVAKYLDDIVEEFDSLERDIILKRIKAISEDLKKISGE